MPTRKVNIVSLGCSKNLVDSERLMRMLSDVGFEVSHESDSDRHDIVVINTCGFIGDAKEESIDAILSWSEAKREGRIGCLIVMGCLSERYLSELTAEIPEVDRWYGKTDWVKMAADLSRRYPASAPYDRVITTPKHHAYLKVSEGCDRFCAFCAIPLITGRHRSRTIDSLVEEAEMLVARGVKELNVIAQDLSSYGKDIYGRQALAELVDKLADVRGVEWIRLHYLYPSDFPMDLLDVMARRDNVCKYIDLALQHVSDTVLANMRRHINGEQTRELLRTIREKVPGIHIRTTLMTGFPGEDDEAFAELVEFVKEQRFERMGAFAYCEEEGTYGAKHLEDSIDEEVKQSRLDRLMAVQEEISNEIQQSKVGAELKVIVDREEDDYYVGRSQFDSPEVDPEVLIKKSRGLKRGEFCMVKIMEAMPFELIGELI